MGKTAIAVRLADKFGWDVISADSRQVYKGLDLGSGKSYAFTCGKGRIIGACGGAWKS